MNGSWILPYSSDIDKDEHDSSDIYEDELNSSDIDDDEHEDADQPEEDSIVDMTMDLKQTDQVEHMVDDSSSAKKRLSTAFESVDTSSMPPLPGLPPRPAKRQMQLPVSASQVRRSPRLIKSADGDMPKKTAADPQVQGSTASASSAPVVASHVRRSPRLNKSAGGSLRYPKVP